MRWSANSLRWHKLYFENQRIMLGMSHEARFSDIFRVDEAFLKKLGGLFFAQLVLCRCSPAFLIGSLVVAIPSRDGLIICADKRRIIGDQVEDNFSKLFLIRPGLALAVTGYPTFFYKGQVEFDAFDISKRVLRQSTSSADVQGYVADLAERLRSEFETEAKSYDPADPLKDNPPTYVLFQVGIFSLRSDQKPNLSLIQIEYHKPSTVTTNVVQQGPETFEKLGITALGDAQLVRELKEGHDPTFDHLRNDPSFMRFINSTVPAREESAASVESFANRFIQEAHKTSSKIGPTCECVHLTPR